MRWRKNTSATHWKKKPVRKTSQREERIERSQKSH